MAQSRSGPLRRAIAPVRARLVGYIETASVEYLTRVVTELDTGTCQTLVDDIDELSAKLRTSIDTLGERDKQWQQLIVDLGDADVANEEGIYNNVALDPNNGYLTAVEQAKDLLCTLQRKQKEANRRSEQLVVLNADGARATGAEVDDGGGRVRTLAIAKLPKLTLPTFSGDCFEWQNFWGIFEGSVHNQHITKSEKFAYLRAQLAGAALHAIDGIQVNNENYDSAIVILRERFQRQPSQLVGALYSQLKRLPAASCTVSSLVSTFDSLEKIFRQLENAGEAVDNNRSLTLDVLSKYPKSVVKDIMSKHDVGPNSTLKDIREVVNRYIKRSENIAELLEDLDPFEVRTQRSGPHADVDKGKSYGRTSLESARPPTSTSTFTSMARVRSIPSRPQTPQSPCYFCGELHFNAQCPKYATVGQRVNRLRSIRRCARCLLPDHLEANCRHVVRCFSCRTVGQHATTLCPQQFPTKPTSSKDQKGGDAPSGNRTTLLNIGEQAVLMTASTVACNPDTGVTANVRLLFDSGSHRSYVTAACADTLQLPILHNEPLQVSVFGTKRTLSVDSQQVRLNIKLRDGSLRSINAHTTPLITDCPIFPRSLPPEDLMTLQSMQYALADDAGSTHGSIDILIGSDYFWEFLNGARISTPSGLYLVPSTVGLLVAGRYQDSSPCDRSPPQPVMLCLTETYSRVPTETGLLTVCSGAKPLYPDIDEYWLLERIGIYDDPIVKDDDKALAQFNDTVQFYEGRYHVQWPKKDIYTCLPVNLELARGRFCSMVKRLLDTNPAIRMKYQEVIDDQLRRNIIERVPVDEIDGRSSPNQIHYLPHHPVIKLDSETTKMRIVYDASSKTSKDNPSLNECLYRGPVMLPDLCAILIRFRLRAVAVVADVEKAFLQLGLQRVDRDVTRFLFFDDPSKPASFNNIAHFRFCRVSFGVVSSPFLLGAVTQYHLRRVGNWASDIIQQNMYVDNVICSVDDDDVATKFYGEAKAIFSSAGMNLQQWCSNSNDVIESIPTADQVSDRDNKVLGMQWDSRDDTLRLRNNLGDRQSGNCSTKRDVLKIIASVYDPLGLFQPVLIRAKCFLHTLWEDGKGWDENIGESLRSEWSTIIEDIVPMFDFRIPRHPGTVPSENSEVIVFCDASQTCYATVVYIRSPQRNGDGYSTTVVYAKSRLTPKHSSGEGVSMPRLELLGVTIGARAAIFVRRSLNLVPMPRVTIFTDSTCVLHWLRTAKPLSVFVENRVREVKSTPNAEFRYVNTNDNPADYGTRGKSAKELWESATWWGGPAFLSEARETWPVHDSEDDFVANAAKEYKKTTASVTQAFVAGDQLADPMDSPFGINVDDYSSFRRLQRVTIWCIKFIKQCVWDLLTDETRAKRSAGTIALFDGATTTGPVTREELNGSKLLWVRHIQGVNYKDLQDAVKHKIAHTLIKQLGAEYDDSGILRCYGRFEHADIPAEAMSPKLLSRNDHVSNLIIKEIHERQFHAGVGHTLSQLRREFWIPHGRNAVRKVISRCLLCRKHKGAPFALPRMPPWPRERVARASPFRFTGLDYFGPVNVKIGETIRKSWVCLFTCLAIRAVHLEWVSDCSAQEFMQCVIRFISRRGTPEQIISDNAPQFRVTKLAFDKMWGDVLRDDSVQTYVADKGIDWKFTTQLAPWQGGFYERLVGVVKASFKAAIGRRLLTFGEFITLCAEVEAIANTRPITYVYGDLPSGQALRPIDFMTDLPVGMPVTDRGMRLDGLGDAGKNLIRLWKLKQSKLDALWKFWYDEYLLSLRERGQSKHRQRKGALKSSPSPDEVVLVKDADTPRGSWKLAKVVRVIVSNDGAIRSAEIQLPNNIILRRSVSHLFPLEIDTVPANQVDEGDVTTDIGNGEGGAVPTDGQNVDGGTIDKAVRGRHPSADDEFPGFTRQEVEEAEQRVNHVQAIRDNALPSVINSLTAAACALHF